MAYIVYMHQGIDILTPRQRRRTILNHGGTELDRELQKSGNILPANKIKKYLSKNLQNGISISFQHHGNA